MAIANFHQITTINFRQIATIVFTIITPLGFDFIGFATIHHCLSFISPTHLKASHPHCTTFTAAQDHHQGFKSQQAGIWAPVFACRPPVRLFGKIITDFSGP